MVFPCAIGVSSIPAQVAEYFEDTLHEYLIAVGGGGTSAARLNGNKHLRASANILGYVDLTTGRKSDVKASVQWVLTDRESKDGAYFKLFEQGVIYRVNGLPPKRLDGADYLNNPFRMGGVYVTEILERGVRNDYLEGLLGEYSKPESVRSDVLGELRLDRDLGWFEGKCSWLDKRVSVYLSTDDTKAAELLLSAMEQFYSERERWDKELRACAANDLTDTANDWMYDGLEDGEEPREITKEDFARRIQLESIELDTEGSFTVFFSDDDMFAGHSVVVYGTTKWGTEYAEIAG